MTSSSKKKQQQTKLAIHWFRNGLRFHDNPSLLDACNNDCNDFLLPLVIIDPDTPFAQTKNRQAGCIRANFILESLKELSTKFQKIELNDGSNSSANSRLIVIVGKPKQVLPDVIESCLVSTTTTTIDDITLYYERDPAAPVRKSDSIVFKSIQDKVDQINTKKKKNNNNNQDLQHVKIKGYDSHTLHPMDHYTSFCKNQVAPATYGGFTKIFTGRIGDVPCEVDEVTTCPPLPTTMVDVLEKKYGSSLEVPTLTELGYDPTELVNREKGGITFQGGEDAGIELLKTMTKRKSWICTFEKPKTSPNALTVDTTGLSPYVKHGCISCRRFYHELAKVYAEGGQASQKLSIPPVSLHGQLMWREYNYLMGYTTPNFDMMVGNPIARQIPWDDDPTLLAAWRDGKTGYPFIDAIMTQLKETGWIHHLARHAVACFLTRGDLWQSWESGAAVFEERLIDADWSINNFNWQWLSCTAHFYQYFRCYSPIAFGKKTDANGDYIRKWLPQFKKFPAKYIYEPWKAPIEIQKKCGVIIGEDYPEPIVHLHTEISKSNMQRMKEAYDAHKSQNAVVRVDGASSGTNKRSAKRRKT